MWKIDVPYSEVVPDIIEVIENSSVTFYCGSTSPVYWMYVGKNLDLISRYEPLLPKHLQSPKQLTLHNLSRSDIGFYSCLGTKLMEIQSFLLCFMLLLLIHLFQRL